MFNFFKRLFILGIIIFFIFIGSAFLYVKFSPVLNINSTNSITLYDNSEEAFFKGNNSKEWVSLENISDYLIDATISTEDKNFYKHFGFDFLRILKACYINLKVLKTYFLLLITQKANF